MAYIRFEGTDQAYGWFSAGRFMAGGLTPGAEYLLITERGARPFRADARGRWQAQLGEETPLCVARGGHAALYAGERLGRAAAEALIAARTAPPRRAERPQAEPACPACVPDAAPRPTAAQPVALPERAVSSALEALPEQPQTVYRKPGDAPPVDALPQLIWPEAAAQLRPFFERNPPLRLFDTPGWRTVQVQEAGMRCCFGYRAQGDRVAEVLYAVQARGGMVTPRGLRGYRWERALDGSGWWTLRQRV